MNAIKDQAFREFGDQGAETLERYFVQLEYTVLWCIRMLDRMSNIEAVMPEAIEDLVIVRPDLYELHQVKTRSESQGPWTFNDVMDIICQQYHRRKAFLDKRCTFHFVSDGLADNRKSNAKQPDYPASLFQLKHLLEILHDDQPFTVDERCLLDAFQNSLIPKLQQQLVDKHNDAADSVLMAELLRNTWIETNSSELKRDALNELHFVLVSDHMVDRQYTTHQLHRIHDQILLLVLKKVLGTKSLSERKIIRDDMVKCMAIPNPVREIDLDKLPGETVLEKKTLLGGFDTTEIPNFNRQRKQADWTWRRIGTFGLDFELERLTTALLDLQSNIRHRVCRLDAVSEKPGPKILDLVRSEIPRVRQSLFPNNSDIDDQFCLGILWNQTDACAAWWHGLENQDWQS